MKEATGELSMTAIVVVILAVVAVIAPIIIRTVGSSLKIKAACQASYGCDTNACTKNGSSTTKCYYQPGDGDKCAGTSTTEGCQITCSCKDLGYN